MTAAQGPERAEVDEKAAALLLESAMEFQSLRDVENPDEPVNDGYLEAQARHQVRRLVEAGWRAPASDAPAVRLHPGDKVRFAAQKQRYTVQAVTPNGRYAICTKPFNARKTVLYTIVDFKRNVRGPDDLIFSFGYETPEQVERNMDLLERGTIEVSYRRCVPLDIAEVFRCGDPSGAYASPERVLS